MEWDEKLKINKKYLFLLLLLNTIIVKYALCILPTFFECKSCERISMYPNYLNYTTNEPEFNALGFYVYNYDYYCVWTKGLLYEEIIDTEYHEACHALIDNDYEHFCGK